MKEELVNKAYEVAKERYAAVGVDTDKVLDQMQNFHLSLHCWQADDVMGFENNGGSLTGGIQTTGNYPGRARNIDELRQDILKAASYIPGTHRLNLHEIYGDFKGEVVDRDQVEPKHFQSWIDWGKEHNMKLDFNSTSFSHPKSGSLSLANPDEGIRQFWIEHTKRCRAVAEAMGEAQGDPCIMNLWVHDGSKDITVNRMKYRELLKDSLDQIYAEPLDSRYLCDCMEGKVFSIANECFTAGSHDFYIAYAAKNQKGLTIDTGHFHPTENYADKISAVFPFVDGMMYHLSRGVRWDSDHTLTQDEPYLFQVFQELVRADLLNKRVAIGLDFFDAQVNRVTAWIVGLRAAGKALLAALLEPTVLMREAEYAGNLGKRMAMLDECKNLPLNAVWDYLCWKKNAGVGMSWLDEMDRYEREVQRKRV